MDRCRVGTRAAVHGAIATTIRRQRMSRDTDQWRADSGATTVEYAVMLGIAVIAAITLIVALIQAL